MDTKALEYWQNICVKAFNNDPKANEFVQFIESSKVKPPTNGFYSWETNNEEFQHHLKQLNFTFNDNKVWILSSQTLTVLLEEKRKTRSEWHIKRQEELKAHLNKILSNTSKPLDISNEQRLALVKEFSIIHKDDVGSVPFLRGLVGCLKYQLQNKYHVIEWKLSEYVLTQNDEEAMESYIRLLQGVLGFQLLYQDDDDSDKIIINIHTNQDPVLIWQTNPTMDNHFIQSVLKYLPTQHNLNDYQVSNTKRNHQSIFQWIYSVLTHCLSSLLK